MRLHPLIPGTLALWQFQNDFLDYSGNNLTASPVDVVANTPVTAPGFTPLSNKTNGVLVNDPCLVGVDLNAGSRTTKLMMPITPLLQMTGPMTVEWLMVQEFTFDLTYWCCADPTLNRAGPDRTGSLYTGWSSSGNPEISDQNLNGGSPNGSFPGYNDHVLFNWSDVGRVQSGDWHAHHFAYTRDSSGNWQSYRDGVTAGSGVPAAGANVATGVERFFIGGFEKEQNGQGAAGLFASVRVLNYTRTAAQIAADASYAVSPCQGREPISPGAVSSAALGLPIIGAAGTGHVFRYQPAAFGDVYPNPKPPGAT